ncbi:hypothetical protein Acor_61720 [Acrocarpospora corrugata]|uniref:DUF3052 domain-containing protein n=1 Tax=Acrocarpospora corrugata TaxID=35763 RepID=A0A5M3W5S8_9ACTN|nr:DUF3052 domain-containing protein [Acrocarpospora corrugata]GES04106.1 hypothetical protein Acor_61720 [Acrocarpospora corrugata]
MVGYSGTPLPKKLGIKPGHRVLLIDAPGTLAGDGVLGDHADDGAAEPYDVILLFCPDQAALHAGFPPAAARLAGNGGLWVCWPKKSSGVPTDLTENPIRDYGLARKLVDNKVCAVDATWSGLRFVYRLADR